MNAPRRISETTLLAIYAQQAERFGGLHGVRDNNAVQSTLARPINRTALASALIFLAINRLAIHVPPVELFELTMSAALGKSDDASTAEYLRPRLVARAV